MLIRAPREAVHELVDRRRLSPLWIVDVDDHGLSSISSITPRFGARTPSRPNAHTPSDTPQIAAGSAGSKPEPSIGALSEAFPLRQDPDVRVKRGGQAPGSAQLFERGDKSSSVSSPAATEERLSRWCAVCGRRNLLGSSVTAASESARRIPGPLAEREDSARSGAGAGRRIPRAVDHTPTQQCAKLAEIPSRIDPAPLPQVSSGGEGIVLTRSMSRRPASFTRRAAGARLPVGLARRPGVERVKRLAFTSPFLKRSPGAPAALGARSLQLPGGGRRTGRFPRPHSRCRIRQRRPRSRSAQSAGRPSSVCYRAPGRARIRGLEVEVVSSRPWDGRSAIRAARQQFRLRRHALVRGRAIDRRAQLAVEGASSIRDAGGIRSRRALGLDGSPCGGRSHRSPRLVGRTIHRVSMTACT